MAQDHTDLVNRTILAVCSIPNVRAWPNQTGVARAINDDKKFITFGLRGSSDIIGIMRCKSGVGAFLAIECKVGKDSLRDSQIFFQAMIRNLGGLYIEMRENVDVIQIIQSFMLNN